MGIEEGQLKFRVDELGDADQKAAPAPQDPKSLVSRMGVGVRAVPAQAPETPLSEKTGLVSEYNPYPTLPKQGNDVPRVSEPPRRKEI